MHSYRGASVCFKRVYRYNIKLTIREITDMVGPLFVTLKTGETLKLTGVDANGVGIYTRVKQ